jgi:hypothetical protein
MDEVRIENQREKGSTLPSLSKVLGAAREWFGTSSFSRAAELTAVAANGAIACFSRSFVPFSLDADRTSQL